jgi:5,10-methylenetetrahydrofolate reductase
MPIRDPRKVPPLVQALQAGTSVVSAELRPPRAELAPAAGMDAWIDTYHAVSGLVRDGTYVFLTDSAVGAKEENNLRHLVINLGSDVSRDRVIPFLTTKHTMDFCLAYAERAWQQGFSSLVVLGGDRTVGPPRCVSHAWQLREKIREHVPDLTLGGWANPHQDPAKQAGFVNDDRFSAEFFLTQVVSHHDLDAVSSFLTELDARNVTVPGVFGVFYYRSASPKTLEILKQFLPVPAEGLIKEFGEGVSADEICARTIRGLKEAGVKNFYVSNLPIGKARQTLERVMKLI